MPILLLQSNSKLKAIAYMPKTKYKKMDNWKYVAIYIVVRVLPLITAVTTRGIVSLDDLTFYKVIQLTGSMSMLNLS